ncbi:ABC transporter ATP-binding protein [Neorickettsia sennetsu]|uniref:Lipoprotein-releasing system ATP-binding protein LolD n=1 Tax=Ehrlichia sennetsu (strain ATCC VR-367 / Miyayama) TaxID=222891 RepID=LOLD_EHRS3|nr:ABC transporter ATP-binding protein [Neorickettsia sennetsu]Q2GE91.1 RecName: Full=Lipoprotein-releasing system ATP-binding protein LolD [Neorickettsia sennetsu str. Miyayama]ABD46430.1 putative lipoprotein releasing system ATP-binding protein LolD [Neorickettsia sennetsu str. Miyayama]
MSGLALEFCNVSKFFRDKTEQEIAILRNTNLQIHTGEIIALIGASGVGKTTTLQIAGLLNKQDSGKVKICGKEASHLDTTLRRKEIGFIYQFHHLLSELNVLKNVMLPLLISGTPKTIAEKRAKELLEFLKLEKVAYQPVDTLSGGQKQRVAVARAVIKKPALIIADEPTGNLDPNTAKDVFDLVCSFAKENGSAVFLATHDPSFLQKASRVLEIVNHSLISSI